MTSPASQIPRAVVASLAVAIVLSAGSSRGWAEAAASSNASTAPPVEAMSRSANPFGHHFPNVVLKAHTGRNVRFYEDLLKDKIVLINFMYATCTER